MNLVDAEDRSALNVVTAQLSASLKTVRDSDWTRPTPCDDWDVRALVDHIVGGNWFTINILAGTTAEDALASTMADFADGVPTADQAALSMTEQLHAFQQPGIAERTLHHVAGDLEGRHVLRLRLHDLIVHSWDLARSFDPSFVLPNELADWGLHELADPSSSAVEHFMVSPQTGSGSSEAATRYLQVFGRSAGPERGFS